MRRNAPNAKKVFLKEKLHFVPTVVHRYPNFSVLCARVRVVCVSESVGVCGYGYMGTGEFR
jgi:hypothetical protein